MVRKIDRKELGKINHCTLNNYQFNLNESRSPYRISTFEEIFLICEKYTHF